MKTLEAIADLNEKDYRVLSHVELVVKWDKKQRKDVFAGYSIRIHITHVGVNVVFIDSVFDEKLGVAAAKALEVAQKAITNYKKELEEKKKQCGNTEAEHTTLSTATQST